MFIEHDAEEIVQSIDVLTEENYLIEKDTMIRIGITQINETFNKKMKFINRETAK